MLILRKYLIIVEFKSVFNGTFIKAKICKRYLTHFDKSVFEGEISVSSVNILQYELDEWIRKDRDSVLIFKSQNKKWLNKEFWGMEDDLTSNFF